jgi:probable HAF family extracellular repeat protein
MFRTVATAVVLTFGSAAHAASFTPLGDLPGGDFLSTPTGVSTDGSVVVGYGNSASGEEAFRWTSAGGMVGLGDLAGGGYLSRAWGVSGDGTIVVGRGTSASGTEAFRWTAADGMHGFGDIAGGAFESQALAVSADGTTIAGYVTGDFAAPEPVTWTSAGMTNLRGSDPNLNYGFAIDVSADGSVVVGTLVTYGGRAFRWSSETGIVNLGVLPTGWSPEASSSHGVSGDGSVVVGCNSTHALFSCVRAFRWTSATGMVSVGDDFFDVNDVSSDGSILIGTLGSIGGAAYWTEQAGMQALLDYLVANGATGLSGWVLYEANAMSADGKWIVGTGVNPSGQREAFIAEISPVPLPAAAWFIAPAVGLLAPWVRRRAST